MKRIGFAMILPAVLVLGCGEPNQTATKVARAKDGEVRILCSFFPMYLFTKAVVGDRPNVSVDLMVPANLGCPHDYDLRTDDVKKIVEADLFVLNGGNLEEFVEKLRGENPKMTLVDTSKGIEILETFHEPHDHDHGQHEGEKKGTAKSEAGSEKSQDAKHDHDHDHDAKGGKKAHADAKHDHDHDHDHGGVNPHFFSWPGAAAKQVKNIAEALAKADPAGAAEYRKNAEEYGKELESLAEDFRKRSKDFKTRKIVTVHEVFEYLVVECGLDVVGTIQSSAGHEPSSAKLRELIDTIKKEKAAAVFTEPQYSDKVAQVVSKEAGVPIHSLDPVAQGPADAQPDYYINKMRENLETLTKALGSPAK